MKKEDYVPRRESRLIIWGKTFKSKLAQIGASLGVTPGEITEIETAVDDMEEAIKQNNLAQIAAQVKRREKDATKKKSLAKIRRTVKRMKTHTNWAPNISAGFGTEAVDQKVDKDNFKPVLRGRALRGFVKIQYTKKGVDGMNIYSQYPGDTEWTFLRFDSRSPYPDTRPLRQPGVPEERLYSAIAVMHDKQIGQRSDTLSVVFAG
ncbi:MAG TPA: hypothetical protein VI757_10470 [Bacteroidia bacterium]|nr:hypothetical protein [Bacteroidia bacterium]